MGSLFLVIWFGKNTNYQAYFVTAYRTRKKFYYIENLGVLLIFNKFFHWLMFAFKTMAQPHFISLVILS